MDKLFSIVQKGGESVRDYIERFRNLSLLCPAGMSLPMLLQTCRDNFFDKVKVRMGAVNAHTWKELVEQAEIAEKSAKKFKPSTLRWRTNNKGHDTTESSDTDTLAVEVSGTKRQYSFKNKHVVTIFHLLSEGNKLKFSEARRSWTHKRSQLLSFS